MAMSRKHYRAFAESISFEVQRLQAMRGCASKRASIATVETLAEAVADTCKRDNSAFRYDTFYTACGLDANGKMPKK